MKKIDGLEKGEISLASFAKLITDVWGNESNDLLSLKEARNILYNTALLRNLIRGKRDSNVFNYQPMPIENELEKVEYFYRRLVLNGIISDAKKDIYSLDTLGNLWTDFCLAHKFEYGELPPGWNDGALATKTKNALAKILLKILKEELNKKTSDKRRDQLMLCLSGIHASYNFSDPLAKKTTALMKKFDPSDQYKYKWAQMMV